jgi:hypothetical protein
LQAGYDPSMDEETEKEPAEKPADKPADGGENDSGQQQKGTSGDEQSEDNEGA